MASRPLFSTCPGRVTNRRQGSRLGRLQEVPRHLPARYAISSRGQAASGTPRRRQDAARRHESIGQAGASLSRCAFPSPSTGNCWARCCASSPIPWRKSEPIAKKILVAMHLPWGCARASPCASAARARSGGPQSSRATSRILAAANPSGTLPGLKGSLDVARTHSKGLGSSPSIFSAMSFRTTRGLRELDDRGLE